MADDPWAAAGFKEAEPSLPPQAGASQAPPKIDPWAAAGFKEVMPGAGPFSEAKSASGAPVRPVGMPEGNGSPPHQGTLLQSHHDAELAARQGVNPNALSKYFPAQDHSSSPLAGVAPKNAPKKLGYLDEGAEFPVYVTSDGQAYRINPKTDFLARDPDTGHMAVYARNEQTDENRFVSASRLMMPGMAVGPLPGGMGSTPTVAAPAARALQTMPHSSAAPPASVVQSIAQRTAEAAPQAARAEMATERAADITNDIGAFDRLSVRKPPITFAEGPVSGVGQMVSRIPFIGDPIKKSLDQALVGAKSAADVISTTMAPSRSVEQAGQVLQSGLERFRTAGVSQVEPGQLSNIGIQPRSPGNYIGELVSPLRGSEAEAQLGGQVVVLPNGSLARFNPDEHFALNDAGRLVVYDKTSRRGEPLMSQGASGRVEQAAPIRDQIPGAGLARTSRGAEVLAARPLDEVMLGRRSASDLTDAELTQLNRTPTQHTSFAARAEGLYEKARRNVPAFIRTDARDESTRLATPNTRSALNSIDKNIANQIAGQGTIDGGLAERLRNPHAHFSLDDLFAIRTEVGRAFGNLNPLQATLNRRQLGELYAGLSKDIEVGLRDIANRAYIRARPGNQNSPSYVAPEVAKKADQALRDFRTADRFYRLGTKRMERFSRILGMDNPQQAVGVLLRAALDGEKGNLGMLRSAMQALRPEERQQISSLILDQMGKPKPSARGMVESTGFSPSSFMSRWNGLDAGAKDLLFGGEYKQAMDDLVRVTKRLANQDALSNTSRSGTDIINYATMIGSGGMMMSGHTWALGALLAPMSGFSVMFSRPEYVRMVQKYAEAKAAAARAPTAVTAPRMVALINQLNRAAIKDPALLPAVEAISAENGVRERQKERQPVQ